MPALTRRQFTLGLGAVAAVPLHSSCGGDDEVRRQRVVEARSRIGGRTWTATSLGLPIDLGGAWIHGSGGNP